MTQTATTPNLLNSNPVYQGQYGEFTITPADRLGVITYRTSLAIASLALLLSTLLLFGPTLPLNLIQIVTILYAIFCISLGVSLATIHIYLVSLHRLLQICWAIGCISSLVISLINSEPLALVVYHHPITLYGIGFIFVALTGIYFKEAFCFNRLETKILTPLVPLLILGYLWGILSPSQAHILLTIWALLFAIFALRKAFQPIPDDIGDKSVFDYLHNHVSQNS